MSSEKAVAIRELVSAKKDRISKILGDITPERIDAMEEQIAKVLATVPSTHFVSRAKYGHLAMVLTEAEYQKIIADSNWTYVPPRDLGAYDAAVVNTANAAQRAQLEATHNRKNAEFQVFCGAQEGAKDLILLRSERMC